VNQISSDTIVFTTSSYKRAQKRMNHFCLLRDGTFFLKIDGIVMIDCFNCPDDTFLTGKLLGVKSKTTYLPPNTSQMPSVKGFATKCEGTSLDLKAVRVSDIYKKCVVACYSEISDSVILTSIVNSFETD
jgi:hypothetical protein